VAAIDAGDVARLDALLGAHPELVRARTNLDESHGYFAGATLLHHVAWNPSRPSPVPDDVVAIARLLIDRGADVGAVTLGTNGGSTMGLLVTSKQASDADVSGPLMQLILDRGAKLDIGDSSLDQPLANHAPRAAEKLIELGAKPDLCAAAALGRMDLLRQFFDETGSLRLRSRRQGRELSARDTIGLAMLFAYVNRRREAVDFLLEKDGNWNMIGVNNGTALHRAAHEGDLGMVQRLVAKGADIGNRENPYGATPLSWADHNKQRGVFDWLVANCAIDLHDAVSFDLRDHVDARLDEDPASVNRKIDHWRVPGSTPLYWACWTTINSPGGMHAHDASRQRDLVRHLLDRGADPNIVCGNGRTALDLALEAGEERLMTLLRRG
jgi:ankyrin repeat protein